MGCHVLLQGVAPTQRSNPYLTMSPALQGVLYHQGRLGLRNGPGPDQNQREGRESAQAPTGESRSSFCVPASEPGLRVPTPAS